MPQVTDPLLLQSLQNSLQQPPSPAGPPTMQPTSPAESMPPTIAPQAPNSAPASASDSYAVPRFLATAGARGAQALIDSGMDPLGAIRRLISPGLEEIEQEGKPHPGRALADWFLSKTGEYQPTTGTGRTGMAASTGAAAGAPFGLPGMAIGALGGTAGELARQYAPEVASYFGYNLSPSNTERVATAATLLPGVAAAARPSQPALPTARELKAKGGADLDATRASGVEVQPSPFVSMAQRLEPDLYSKGFTADLAPNTYKVLSEIQAVPPAGANPNVSFINIHAMRQRLQNIIEKASSGASPDKLEAEAARRVLNEFNQTTGSLGQNPADLAPGTTPAAAAAATEQFRTGLANYSAAQKSNVITGELDRARTGILERAEARAQAANSGKNLDNSIRGKTESFLESRRSIAPFTDAELDRFGDVVQGSRTQNFLRTWGNRLGGGGGLGQLLTGVAGGAAVGGAAGKSTAAATIGAAAPVTVGLLAKSMENALARRSLNETNRAILMNSPEYQARLNAMPPREAAILERALKAGLIGGQL